MAMNVARDYGDTCTTISRPKPANCYPGCRLVRLVGTLPCRGGVFVEYTVPSTEVSFKSIQAILYVFMSISITISLPALSRDPAHLPINAYSRTSIFHNVGTGRVDANRDVMRLKGFCVVSCVHR